MIDWLVPLIFGALFTIFHRFPYSFGLFQRFIGIVRLDINTI